MGRDELLEFECSWEPGFSAGHSLKPQNNEVGTFGPYFTGVIEYTVIKGQPRKDKRSDSWRLREAKES